MEQKKIIKKCEKDSEGLLKITKRHFLSSSFLKELDKVTRDKKDVGVEEERNLKSYKLKVWGRFHKSLFHKKNLFTERKFENVMKQKRYTRAITVGAEKISFRKNQNWRYISKK